jgi:tRNA 5-methylaminomethyl-2-thiouridine biosynthesis bifunctional protein
MPISPGEISFGENGIPLSPEYGDVYHSADGGLEQSRQVFLQGCNLPNAWQDKNRFVILETGFGLGLNFLATWQAFRKHPGQCHRLHFISVEKHPLSLDSLKRCHAAWPALAEFAKAIQTQWPVRVAGYHRLSFDEGRVQLTLIFDAAESALKQLDAKADAIYLDGFSPAKNPAIWSPDLLKQLGKLAAPGAHLATWCVAGTVRLGLQQAGFSIQRKPGFGRKKERLEARFSPPSSHGSEAVVKVEEKSAALIGAGIAGTSLAHALLQRGWQVTLIEKHPGPAMGASGNPAGVVRPQLTLDESFNGRLSRQAFLHTVTQLATLPAPPLPPHCFRGVLHLARDEKQAEHMPAMLAAHHYPENFSRWVTQDEASDIAGIAVTSPGLYFPQGGWMSGPRIALALLSRCKDSLLSHFTRTVTGLEPTSDGWRVWAHDSLLAECPVVILTGAHEAVQFANLPLTPVRGQITTLPDNSLPGLKVPVTREGYVLPTHGGIGNIGASFAFDDEPTPRETDQVSNLQRLGRLLENPPAFNARELGARVSFRAATPDRLPLAGALANEATSFPPEISLQQLPRLRGLYALSGLGARGLVWAPFLAQALAARLDGEAWWLPRDLWNAIDSARFLLRDVRKRPSSENS